MAIESRKNKSGTYWYVYKKYGTKKLILGEFDQNPEGRKRAEYSAEYATLLIDKLKKKSLRMEQWQVEELEIELFQTIRSQVDALVQDNYDRRN